MNTKIHSQRGQAIVLIALALLGILAIAGLAIDGSNVYSSRRHAQSTADNASLAAALASVNLLSANDGALGISRRNGFDDSTVEIFPGGPFTNCKGETINPVDPNLAGDKAEHYIEVKIKSGVATYLGGVVGIQRLNYCVVAIARSLPTKFTSVAFGNAVAAVQCSGSRTMDTSGASGILVTGGGLFSNSSSDGALYAHISGSGFLDVPSLTSVGSASVGSGISAPVIPKAFQMSCPLPAEVIPKYRCDYTYGDFPPSSTDGNVTISVGTAIINPGVYCISGSFSAANDLYGNGVTFIMQNEGIDWNGNSKIDLHAPTTGQTKGLLIMLPPSNDSVIKLNGTADQVVSGSVFAPSSEITLSGDFGTEAMVSQWIGATVKMIGSLTATINFDESKLYKFTYPPIVELSH